MSARFPQYSKSSFPNSLDTYIIFTDVNASNKSLVDQYYTYVNAGDFANATTLLQNNPSLKYVVVTASTMQTIYDALMAIESTYASDVVATIGTCVTNQGAWNSLTSYPLFGIVTYSGKAYMCNATNTPAGTLPTNASYFTQMTIVGASGTGMSFYSSYDSTQTYKTLDSLPYANKLYVSLVDNNLNHQPDISPDYWSTVITVPFQVITSQSQPTGQDANGYWYQTNSTDNSYNVMKSNGDNTYTQKFPISNADFISNGSKNSIITTLACTKSGTIYALTGLTATSGIATCIFKADADYAAGNTFTVGGTAYTVVTSGGEVLRDGAFLSGDIVGVKLDIDAKKLYIRQDSAAQVGAVRQLAEITQAILDNPTIGYCYIGSVGPDLTGLPLNQWGMISCFALGILCQQTIYYANATYIRFGFNIWGTWQRINDGGHAASADAASGSIALTAPGLRNNVISSATPSGGAEGDTWDQV